MAIKFLNNIDVIGSVTSSSDLTLSGLSAQNSEATALVINGSGVVGTRELGSNAFNSTSFLATSGKAADSNLLDGLDLHTGRNNVANRVVRTQGNGYIEAGWINTTSGNTTNTITDVYVNTNDGYIRKATAAVFKSQLGILSTQVTSGTQTIAGAKTFSSGIVTPSVRATGGNDGGFCLRQWTHSSGYASLATNGMSGLEYCVISDGTNTFVGAGSSGKLTLRGPANDSSPQIAIDGSSITVDNGPSNVGQGSIRAKYKSSDNSAGITTTVGVKNASQSQNLTLTIKDGVITGVSSDRRLKTNITLIGTSDSGINIYTFEYKYKFSIEGVGLFQGVMSDEVPKHAVSVDHHGFDIVDYSVIDVEFKRVSI